MEAKLIKSYQIHTKNLSLDPKAFQKILVWSCCVTSFFRCCTANLTFIALQNPIYNQRGTHGGQTSQIKPNRNKTPPIRFKDLLENFSLKLMCDVILPTLPDHSGIPCFTMSNVQWDDYPMNQKSSNCIKLLLKPLTISKVFSENLNLKLLCDVIFPSFPGQSDIPCFTMGRRFPVVTHLIPHALFYNGQFSIRWLALSTNFLKPYQIGIKSL